MKRRRPRRSSRQRETAELNVTAFMNLMVVLVPFLLVMAVFSRLAILELNLPGSDGGANSEPPAMPLEVVVRQDRLQLQVRDQGPPVAIPNTDSGYDLKTLSAKLQQIKAKHPGKTDITVLLEPDIAYENVVAVMDAVRVVPQERDGRIVKAELFPDISIGDAPQAQGGTS
jgi:biopolymer transport protein ExbD